MTVTKRLTRAERRTPPHHKERVKIVEVWGVRPGQDTPQLLDVIRIDDDEPAESKSANERDTGAGSR